MGKDKIKDITFVPGKLIPIAVQVWKGSNGEKGLQMALSSWNFLLTPGGTSLRAYLYPFFTIVVVAGI